MKKLLALALALVMAFSMALSVSATSQGYGEAGDLPDTNMPSVDIKVTVNGNVVHKYAFDVEYGSLSFTYSTGMVWDTEAYEYKPQGEGSWVPTETGADKIRVFNHSDMPIAYSGAVATNNDKSVGNLGLEITEGGKINGCKVGDALNSNFGTLTVSVTGKPIVSAADAVTIGQVTVTVTKYVAPAGPVQP